MGQPPPDPRRFCDRLRNELSLDACARLFREAIVPYGFVAFACGEVDLVDQDRTAMYLSDWPREGKRCYFESGFVPRDPLVNALSLFRKAFTSSDLVRDPRFSSLEQNLAAACGWTHGLVVPVTHGGMRFGLVSLVGRGEPVEGAIKTSLCMISGSLFTHVRALIGTGEATLAKAGCSLIEIEALRMVARGVADGEIGRRLGMPAFAAHNHVESARGRLEAKARADMAALGVSFALASA